MSNPTAETVEQEPAAEHDRQADVERRLKHFYRFLEASGISLRGEHLERIITRVAVGEQPSEKVLARWGTKNPILAYENGTIFVYEGFDKESIDREHAVTHEVAESILTSGLFKNTNWQEVVGWLDKSEFEDTGYVKGMKNELEALKADPDRLAEKAAAAGMDANGYLSWSQKRIYHERLAEQLTFYLRSGGNADEMLRLHMEHVPASSLPAEWQEALRSGDRSRTAELYKESGLEERNRYFYQLFHGVLGERTPQDLTNELNNLQTQESADEEHEELLELEMLEAEMGIEAAIQEPPVMAQPPKIRREPSLWDHLKRIFTPQGEKPKFIV